MKRTITQEQLEEYWNGHYEVKIVTPRDENPYMEEFLLDQEELDRFLENYGKQAAIIISIEFLG
ncbi:hypothetical protein ACFLT2_03225 [Acidobacteriota bacterium]